MNDPELIVLDEPTDGVDVQGRRDVRDVLLRLKREGKTIFLNSHLLSELEMVCDEVAILVKGTVVRQGTISDLTLDRQRFEVEVELPEMAGRLSENFAARESGETGMQVAGAVVKIETTDAGAVQPVIDRLRGAGCVIRRVQLMRPTLEELFMETVEGTAGATDGAKMTVGGVR